MRINRQKFVRAHCRRWRDTLLDLWSASAAHRWRPARRVALGRLRRSLAGPVAHRSVLLALANLVAMAGRWAVTFFRAFIERARSRVASAPPAADCRRRALRQPPPTGPRLAHLSVTLSHGHGR
ncbi:hypothetical protein [Streptomyces sp. NPDC045470]|uniref:hypothetical protein n=1 Tax=Streptomyces sp. NPDC045470 TaxID=3155469 RepID=UPI0034077B30